MKMKYALHALTGAAMALAITPAFAADLSSGGGGSMKDGAAATPDWDIAFGGYSESNYIFRGISQSANWPSVSSYSELRYNWSPTVQLYGGSSGESIDFPNRAAAEVDFYGGIRPTFGKLALDFGGWYYWYPGGRDYPGPTGTACTNGATVAKFCNIYEADLSFWEAYAKATYTVTDAFSVGASVNYSPSWLNEGADGTWLAGTAKYTLPGEWIPTVLPKGTGASLSADVGHYWFGRTNSFYNNIQLPDYTAWDLGATFTYKVFSLDFRWYDSDISRANCNTLTSDHTETNGLSNWCGNAFVVKAAFDLTVNTNLK
jgi:uncharacterized protein (TIGR02001 family)